MQKKRDKKSLGSSTSRGHERQLRGTGFDVHSLCSLCPLWWKNVVKMMKLKKFSNHSASPAYTSICARGSITGLCSTATGGSFGR